MEHCEFISNSVIETENFAEMLAKTFVGGEILLLKGEMGAGKTHFVKGLARGLGIDDVVTSPTFALHNSYSGRLTLNHFDFYRIDDSQEVEILGLNEYFYDRHGVSAIEWSENVFDLLPKHCVVITLKKVNDDTRVITVG